MALERSTPVYEPVGDILRSVLEGTEEQYKSVNDIMVSLADEGFLDQHQTRSALDAVANRLLHTLREGDA